MFIWVAGGAYEPYRPPPMQNRQGVVPASSADRVRNASSHAPPAEPRHRRGTPRGAYDPGPEAPEPQRALLARQIMTAPVTTVRAEDPYQEVSRLMHEHGYHHLPVLSAAGTLVGMVSDRDLLRRGAADGPARMLMSERVLSASPDTSIREIARVMVTERIGAVPLLGANGALEGIVTRSDVLGCVVNRAPLDLWIR